MLTRGGASADAPGSSNATCGMHCARADSLINERTVHGHRYHDAIRPTIDTEEFEPA